MQTIMKWLMAANGMIWTFLLAQNAVRHFVFGWGATVEVILIGLVPLVGLLAELVIIRLYRRNRFAAALWICVPSTLIAVLYLIIAEMPGSV